MKVEDLANILTRLVENGFGDSDIDSMDTSEDEKLCLCIDDIHEDQFLKIFPKMPLKDTGVYFTGFALNNEIYIKEEKKK